MEQGPMMTSRRSSLPCRILRMRLRGVADQGLGLGAADGEEADQVLRRRQRRDAGDALVIGLAGLVLHR